MTALRIQEFFRAGGTHGRLLADFGVKAKPHPRFPHLVLFKYDQIASPFAEPLVRECRGIILDSSQDWRVVSRAFDKFFNHGEGHAADIDWTTARVQEKVDGSLCVLYPYAGEWHVATSGTPDASGEVHGAISSFADYFWGVLPRASLPPVDCGLCFFFELTGPLNRVVVPHQTASLTLLGARNIETQQEIAPAEAASLVPGVRVVQEFPLGSFEDIAASFEHISPLSQEGYVVVDAQFRRRKVKHPGYVALHHAKDGLGTKAFVEIARSGEVSEVLTAFPEFKPLLDDASARFTALLSRIEADYAALREIPEQKAFALEAVKRECSAALFSVRSGKAPDVRGFLRTMPVDKLVTLLGYARPEASP